MSIIGSRSRSKKISRTSSRIRIGMGKIIGMVEKEVDIGTIMFVNVEKEVAEEAIIVATMTIAIVEATETIITITITTIKTTIDLSKTDSPSKDISQDSNRIHTLQMEEM